MYSLTCTHTTHFYIVLSHMYTYNTFGHSCGTLACAWSMHAHPQMAYYTYNTHPQRIRIYNAHMQMYVQTSLLELNLHAHCTHRHTPAHTHLPNHTNKRVHTHYHTHTRVHTRAHALPLSLPPSLPPPFTHTRTHTHAHTHARMQ